VAALQLTPSRFTIAGIPVFMYHDVCANLITDERYDLPESVFRDHMLFLREQGIAVVDLSTLASTAGCRCAVLTFDDGLSSHYENVFPALLDSGFRATFFTTSTLINRPGYLTWSQMREMAGAGMTFGSHGHYHLAYSGLKGTEVHRQLLCSRLTLEDRLGNPVCSFSAPFGSLNRAVIDAANRAGFQQICSSKPWPASPRASVVSRLAIYRNTDVSRFSALAFGSAFPLLSRLARNAILHVPKQVLLRTWPGRLGLEVHGGTR
jgi:peptidoglycan/xylan/chitin deacetylase (PgdA/CDA1 family)